MIERKKIFEIVGKSTTSYHSALLTSFSFDPIFFNNYYFGKLHACGITNIVVLIDSSNYDKVLSSLGQSPDKAVIDYNLVRQKCSSTGVFHPKVSFLVGKNKGLVLVGSGNLTYSGYSVNQEIWGAVRYDERHHNNLGFFKSVWSYLESILPNNSPIINQQLSWMKTDWLSGDIDDENGWVHTEDGCEIRFLANQEKDMPIFKQVQEIIFQSKVRRLTIMSPFYDREGQLIQRFKNEFAPERMECIFSDQGTYPEKLLRDESYNFMKWRSPTNKESKDSNLDNGRLHAKVYQFQTDNGCYLVIGSPNASTNAWIDANGEYTNDEAAIILHNPQNEDYIDINSVAEKFDIGKIMKPTFASPNKDKQYTYSLTRSEICNNKLTISTEPEFCDGSVRILSNEGKKIREFDSKEYKDSVLDNDLQEKAFMAVLVKDDLELSNRCLIISQGKISKWNPSQEFRKFSLIFNSQEAMENKIIQLLECVSFEDKSYVSKIATSHKVQKRIGRNEEKVITKDEFDNLDTSKNSGSSNPPSAIIVDCLRSLIERGETKKENIEENDVSVSEEEVNRGTDKHKNNDDVDQEKVKKSILSYFDKYQKHSERHLAIIENKKDRYGKNCPIEKRQKEQSSLDDYSTALILVLLIYFSLSENKKIDIPAEELRNRFITNIGEFLLRFREPYNKNDNINYEGIHRNHINLCYYSLLLTSMFEWPENESVLKRNIKLLLLNLYDSFRENIADLQEMIKKLNENIETDIKIRDDSRNLINKIYQEYIEFNKKYIEFNKNKSEPNFCKKIDSDWKSAYIYKKNFGFVYCTNFTLSKDTPFWVYDVYFCGYKGNFTNKSKMALVFSKY